MTERDDFRGCTVCGAPGGRCKDPDECERRAILDEHNRRECDA